MSDDTDGEDDSGDGVSHARVPDWAWSALGGQSGDEDYIIINYYPHRDDQDLNDSNHFGDQNFEDVGEHSFLW